MPDEDKRKALAEAAMTTLGEHREALEAAGLAPEIVSAGGTGTHDLSVLELVELAGGVRRADHGPDARADNGVDPNPGVVERSEHAHVGQSARPPGAERDPHLLFPPPPEKAARPARHSASVVIPRGSR